MAPARIQIDHVAEGAVGWEMDGHVAAVRVVAISSEGRGNHPGHSDRARIALRSPWAERPNSARLSGCSLRLHALSRRLTNALLVHAEHRRPSSVASISASRTTNETLPLIPCPPLIVDLRVAASC